MAILDSKFARERFEAQPDPHGLSRELEGELTRLLVESTHRAQTTRWIFDALRDLGHDIYCFDEDGESFEYWTDNWARPHGTHRMSIEVHTPPDDAPSARVLFTSRPLERAERHCPVCDVEMRHTSVWVSATGHGSATAPSVRVRFEFADQVEVDFAVGARSLQTQSVSGYQCPQCKGCWFPPRKKLVAGT